jgi:hypothetical protein
MANIKFPGIDENLTAPGTPWIYYGVCSYSLASYLKLLNKYRQGSYAGARAAHMKVLYPDLVYGAIASSGRLVLPQTKYSISQSYKGVTHATLENWEYMEVIRKAADPKCSSHLENSISSIDSTLAIPRMRTMLKSLFGLAHLEHDEDFASVLEVCLPLLHPVCMEY